MADAKFVIRCAEWSSTVSFRLRLSSVVVAEGLLVQGDHRHAYEHPGTSRRTTQEENKIAGFALRPINNPLLRQL